MDNLPSPRCHLALPISLLRSLTLSSRLLGFLSRRRRRRRREATEEERIP